VPRSEYRRQRQSYNPPVSMVEAAEFPEGGATTGTGTVVDCLRAEVGVVLDAAGVGVTEGVEEGIVLSLSSEPASQKGRSSSLLSVVVVFTLCGVHWTGRAASFSPA